MIKGIYTTNIAIKNLDKAIARYQSVFGVKAERLGETDFAFPGLAGAKLNVNGFYITLITSSSEDTSMARFLEKRGEGLFLLSVRVDAIEEEVKALKEQGLQMLLDKPTTGKFGAVRFVYPKSMHGVQIEVYQPEVGQSAQS